MITLYIGKSAAGKDTILKQRVAYGAYPIVSYTTRPKREKEVDGVDYHFVSHDEFQYLIETDGLTEYRTYDTLVDGRKDTWYYGTPVLDAAKDYVGVVTVDGAMSFIDYYGADNVNVIYVFASNKTREKRARLRGSFDITEWNRRKEADDIDFSEGRLIALEQKLGKPVAMLDNE